MCILIHVSTNFSCLYVPKDGVVRARIEQPQMRRQIEKHSKLFLLYVYASLCKLNLSLSSLLMLIRTYFVEH